MKKNILSFVLAAIMAAQVFAGDEAKPATEACDKLVAKESCDKPEKFKHCDECKALRKKAREERKAELEARKAERKDLKKKHGEHRKPIFCDDCKKKFADKKPEQWHKQRRDGEKDKQLTPEERKQKREEWKKRREARKNARKNGGETPSPSPEKAKDAAE